MQAHCKHCDNLAMHRFLTCFVMFSKPMAMVITSCKLCNIMHQDYFRIFCYAYIIINKYKYNWHSEVTFVLQLNNFGLLILIVRLNEPILSIFCILIHNIRNTKISIHSLCSILYRLSWS